MTLSMIKKTITKAAIAPNRICILSIAVIGLSGKDHEKHLKLPGERLVDIEVQ